MKSIKFNKENSVCLAKAAIEAGRRLTIEALDAKYETLSKAELALSGKGAANAHDELIAAGAKFIKSKATYKINAFDFEFAVRVTKSVNPSYITKTLKNKVGS